MIRRIQAFADLTMAGLTEVEVAGVLSRWASPECLGSVADRLVAVVSPGSAPVETGLPPGWLVSTRSAVQECAKAFELAAAEGSPLLVILHPVEPSGDAVGRLLDALAADPLFTIAHARLAGAERMDLLPLGRGDGEGQQFLPRRILPHLPAHYVVADFVSPCFLMHPSALEVDSVTGADLAIALSGYMTKARRVGMRSLIVNGAAMGSLLGGVTPQALEVEVSATDEDLLVSAHPDRRRARSEFGITRTHQREVLLAEGTAEHPSLLVDFRNLMQGHNGTARVGLGVLQGLQAAKKNWEIFIWAGAEAAAFHGLEERFGEWTVLTSQPQRVFSASLRLSQPWWLSDIEDLDRLALCNFHLMLDTIMWDIVYPAPPGLDGVWHFISKHADGLAFISEFTRARFLTRFGKSPGAPTLTTLLSCNPADYVDADVASQPAQEDYVFVVGNNLDHKNLRRTVETLRKAFPMQEFKVLGLEHASDAHLETLPSGSVDEMEVARLYAGARAVVFPSYYEGFGFPVLTGLAYGRKVLARHSDLLLEVAAHYRGPGALVSYRSEAELVGRLGLLLQGKEVSVSAFGAALSPGSNPRGWPEVAEELLSFIERVLTDRTAHRWQARDQALRLIRAVR
jgi:glycosyltransferase involved in cell wall biosynthesis